MIVLDRHTAPFFAPQFHSGAVEATFNLCGFEFEARRARDFGGVECIVMRLKADRTRGLFVIRQSEHLEYAALKISGKKVGIWEAIQVLPEKVVARSLRRLFFYAEDSFVIQMMRYGCGQLIHTDKYEKVGAQFSLDYKNVPAELMGHEMDELIAWNSKQWFAALTRVAREPDSDLAQTMAYLQTNDEFKVRLHFGCSVATFQQMRSLLKAALIQEATGGSLVHLENIKWRYWMEASRALDLRCSQPLPESLLLWKERVCAALGCNSLNMSLHEYIMTSTSPRKTGVQHEFNRWLTPTAIEVSAPTAHEILEAQLQLREFERAFPS